MVIELDNGDDKGDDKGDNKGDGKDAYAAFKAVKVEDKVIKEAKRFGVNLVSLTKSYFVTLTLTCR